ASSGISNLPNSSSVRLSDLLFRRSLTVWSPALMVHYFLRHGGMPFGPSSSWQSHHDRGNPSSDTAKSREPEDPGHSPPHHSKDRLQTEKEPLRRRSADRYETAELNRAVDRGGGDCRGIPSAHAVAARRLPLCAAADDPAPDPIITASLSETAWHLAPARLRTRAPRNENSK